MCGTESVRNVSSNGARSTPSVPARDIALLERRQPAATVLSDRFDQRQVTPRVARPRNCTRFSYSRQFGTSGTRSMPNRPSGPEHARHRGESGRQVAVCQQRLQDAVRRDHRVERAVLEGQPSDIAADQAERQATCVRFASRGAAGRRRPLPDVMAARNRSSIAVDRSMPTRRAPARASGSETRPVPHPSSRTGPCASSAMPTPERHVTATERARVFPIVEGRVLVPAPPSPRVDGSWLTALSVGDSDLARHDRPRARQPPRRARLPTKARIAEEDQELDCVAGRVCGSTFHMIQRTG